MKALELLGRLSLNMCIANPMERIAISGTDVYEAIAELEALQQPKSCNRCKKQGHHQCPIIALDEDYIDFCCNRYEAKEH